MLSICVVIPFPVIMFVRKEFFSIHRTFPYTSSARGPAVRPELLVHLVIRRPVSHLVLLPEVLVVLIHLALLLVRQALPGIRARDAEVGDLGLGRRVLGGAGEGIAAAGSTFGGVVGEEATGRRLVEGTGGGGDGGNGWFVGRGGAEGCGGRGDGGGDATGSAHRSGGFRAPARQLGDFVTKLVS